MQLTTSQDMPAGQSPVLALAHGSNLVDLVSGMTASERTKLCNALRRGKWCSQDLDKAADLIDKLGKYIATS